MTRDLLLRGGRVIDPSQGLDVVGDVLIRDGRIEACGATTSGRPTAPNVSIARAIVAPGFIDVHCPPARAGQGGRGDDRHRGARRGRGRFHRRVRDAQHRPVTDNQAAVGFVKRQARSAPARARLSLSAPFRLARRARRSRNSARWWRAGAVAVSDDGKPVESAHLMRTALEYAQTFNIPVAEHCEDLTLARGGSMNEGIDLARVSDSRASRRRPKRSWSFATSCSPSAPVATFTSAT